MLGSRRSLGGEHGTHSSILVWRIPWTEEPGGLQSMGSQRVRHDWSDLADMDAHTAEVALHPGLPHRKYWREGVIGSSIYIPHSIATSPRRASCWRKVGGSKVHRILGLEETLKHNYVLSDVPSAANKLWGCVAIIKSFSLPGSFTRRFSSPCAKKSPLLTC